MRLEVKVRKRIDIGQKTVIERQIAGDGKILAKIGQRVTPDDLVAEGKVIGGFRSIGLALALKVPPEAAAKFLVAKIGDEVAGGETIAIRKKFMGKIEVSAPTRGILSEYDSNSGMLTLQLPLQHQKITASVWGKVVQIVDGSKVLIESSVDQIYGVVGSGRLREGIIKVIGQPSDFLLPASIDANLAGRVIVGGALISRASLAKCLACQVTGIIAGGMHFGDFAEAGGLKKSVFWASSDVGLTVVLLEGFGHHPAASDIFDLFKQHDGKFALIDGDLAKIILPQITSKATSKSFQTPTVEELKVGDRVRIVDPSYFGQIGKVDKITTKAAKLESGLSAILVEVATDDGKISLPYQNLEILA